MAKVLVRRDHLPARPFGQQGQEAVAGLAVAAGEGEELVGDEKVLALAAFEDVGPCGLGQRCCGPEQIGKAGSGPRISVSQPSGADCARRDSGEPASCAGWTNAEVSSQALEKNEPAADPVWKVSGTVRFRVER
jgi:hypothetical protein